MYAASLMSDSDYRFDLLRERYRASLSTKRTALQAAWRRVAADPGDAASEAELRSLVHRLAGSAAAYGYEALGEAATALNAHLLDRRRTLAQILAMPVVERLMPRVLAAMDAVSAGEVRHSGVLRDEGAGLRVILCEDDPDQADVIAAALREAGCEVVVAAHRDLLWERITTWPCDAVVTDYWLEEETALGIVRVIRDEPSFASVAILCFTVERDVARHEEILACGCDVVLTKSEPMGRLIEELHRRVAARRAG